MKVLARLLLESPSEMLTIANVKIPSVNAPRWMSMLKTGPRPMFGNAAMMNLTPVIEPKTLKQKDGGIVHQKKHSTIISFSRKNNNILAESDRQEM